LVFSRSIKRLGLNFSASFHNLTSFCTTTGQIMISCPESRIQMTRIVRVTHETTCLQVH
jgi:hypothetical protein